MNTDALRDFLHAGLEEEDDEDDSDDEEMEREVTAVFGVKIWIIKYSK